MNTLIAQTSEHVGQSDLKTAYSDVERMNKQENTDLWHVDFSEFMYCPDTDGFKFLDNRKFKEFKLTKGYAWVTKSFVIEQKNK